MKKETVLSITNLNKFLDKKQVLFDVNLDIKEGEVFGFLGPNWAGKTTTMKCVLGLIKPESGEVSILWNTNLDNVVKAQIGFMPENTYLYKYLTWYEFLEFNAGFFDIPKNEAKTIIIELLDKVGLKEAWNKLLAKYSKWMLQRIWLAQSIINNPKIVFLDEPMSWLDPLWRKMVKDLIIDLKNNWTTVFFNTHILSDVESICDRFAIINKWHLIAEDKVKNLKIPLEDYFIEKVREHIWDEAFEIK
jgi:ABC-2 type transport system ATP-binding protein